MTHISTSKRQRFGVTAICTLGAAVVFAACASTPPDPTVALKAAEQAIAVADKTRVADAASPELSEARQKLTEAQRAAQDKRMVEAERLANESRVNAELASAKIGAAKEKAVNAEIVASTGVLSQEMQRKSTSGVK